MRIVIPLQSSSLSQAAYDPETERLDITFINGRTYTHEGVPQSVFDELEDAASPGSFYNQSIKGMY